MQLLEPCILAKQLIRTLKHRHFLNMSGCLKLKNEKIENISYIEHFLYFTPNVKD